MGCSIGFDHLTLIASNDTLELDLKITLDRVIHQSRFSIVLVNEHAASSLSTSELVDADGVLVGAGSRASCGQPASRWLINPLSIRSAEKNVAPC